MTDTPKAEQETCSGSNAPTCSASSRYPDEYPQEWKAALEALYIQYSSDPTPVQRYKILEVALGLTGGAYGISSTSDWRNTQEEIDLRNMRVQELEYLEQIGLHKPQYC